MGPFQWGGSQTGSAHSHSAITAFRTIAAIDLFAEVRDHGRLEDLQQAVTRHFQGFGPHWSKSALVEDFATILGEEHRERLR